MARVLTVESESSESSNTASSVLRHPDAATTNTRAKKEANQRMSLQHTSKQPSQKFWFVLLQRKKRI